MPNPMVHHVEQREQRLDRMIERLGVDLSRFRRDAHGATYEQASWNCVRCPNPDACITWLEKFGLTAQMPSDICPNCKLLHRYMATA